MEQRLIAIDQALNEVSQCVSVLFNSIACERLVIVRRTQDALSLALVGSICRQPAGQCARHGDWRRLAEVRLEHDAVELVCLEINLSMRLYC